MATSPFDMNPHALGCPWEPLSQLGLPNVNWCEATLCAWIAEPANTWSNLGYFISAIPMFLWARRTQNPVLRAFPFASIGIGFSSGIYHASVTWAFQILDFIGMYCFLFLPIAFHALRLKKFHAQKFLPLYLGSVAAITVITTVLSQLAFPIQTFILFFAILLITLEARAFLKAKEKPTPYPTKWLLLAMTFILAGFASSAVDATRTVCDPDAHGWFAQGHAVWHWLTAAGLTFLLPHYLEIERLREV